jgi:hypothetical protein
MVRLACCLTVLLLAFVSPARASVSALSEYQFTGDCFDCAGKGVAQLTLTGYTPGNDILVSNFVSFTYDGSNLINPFTITQSDIVGPDTGFISGVLGPAFPGIYSFTLDKFSSNDLFQSYGEGFWCAGFSCSDDVGNNGLWSVASSLPIPEPGSLALLGASVAVVAARRRRAVG